MRNNEVIFSNMRNFHNYIKRELIIKYAKNEEILIDLCCGKGGDMHKWINAKIKNIIGYDINKEYIEEAKTRYSKVNKKDIDIKIIYRNIDLRKQIVDTEYEKVNVITCNFALHYFFKNKYTFNTFIKSITNNLKNNGYFIGTIFDGASVLNKLDNKDFYNYKDFFKIDKINIENTLLGNKIKVYLKDSIIDNISREYLIPFGLFIAEMEKLGFILIDSKIFSELEKDYKYNLEDYEKEFSFLNRYFVFKYIKDIINNEESQINTDNIVYNFDNMKIQDLKLFCKNNNIYNYSKLRKKDLINKIKLELNEDLED